MRDRIVASNSSNSRHMMMSGGRYPVLRTIAILYLIGAAVSLIAGIVGICYVLFSRSLWGSGGWGFRWSYAGYILGATFFAVIGSLAIAEFLKLAMDVARDLRILAGNRVTTVVTPGATVPPPVPSDSSTVVVESTAPDGRINRMTEYLDEETAEGALMRGH